MFDIYGLGNALIDTEFSVSDDFLSSAGLVKGSMTIVTEQKQVNLIKLLNSTKLKSVKTCGGSVCNSIVSASYLGSSVCFSGKLANDHDGELYVNSLNDAGVIYFSRPFTQGVSGKCLVLVSGDAERTMCTFLGSFQEFTYDDVDKTALKKSKWLYIESYLLTNRVSKRAVERVIEFAKSNGVKVAISLSDPSIVSTFYELISEVLVKRADLIFCNHEEASCLTKKNTEEEIICYMKRFCNSFVMTLGASGALLFDGHQLIKSKGRKVDAVDTTGAGDTFSGTFLHSIIIGKNFRFAAEVANYAASKVVTTRGARLDKLSFVNIKKRFGI